jgi:adenylate cyclase
MVQRAAAVQGSGFAARLGRGAARVWLAALACWLAWPLLALLPAAQRLDNAWGDQLTRWRAEGRPGDASIVIVDIDEWSLQAMAADAGKWPWPRSVHAGLLEALLAEKPRAVVFDIFFSDKDILRPDDDAWFGELIGGASNVYLASLQLGDAAVPALLASHPPQAGLERGPDARADARGSLLLPWAVPETGWRTGPVNFTPDADGIGRRYDLYRGIEGWRWPSLPARVARDLGATLPEAPDLRIDFPAGGTRAYTRLLYREVYEHFLQGKRTLPEGFFADRIVVIGTSASGLQDLKPTPIARAYPGMVMVATVIDNLLHGSGLRELPFAAAWGVLGLLLAAVAGAARRARMLLAFALGLGGIGAMAGASAAAALAGGVVTPLPLPALLVVAFLGVLALIQYRERQAELARTVRTFERFMDPEVVRRLLSEEDAASLLASRTCEITVLFSDIRGFTRLSEKRSAVEVVRLLDDYFSRQVAVIFRHGGTLDKFIGDAVMAFWGAPVPHPAQQRAAVECALEMRREMERFRQDYGFAEFEIGVGIHTGPAVVGMIGCEQRYDFTAIGDTVNLASRIEGLCKDRASILVSASTRAGCGADVPFRAHGQAQVKGRDEPVDLYEPTGGSGHANT